MFKKIYWAMYRQTWLGGHISFKNTTIYGFNGMNLAVNISTKRWGYICFAPPTGISGWYYYLSPDATPSCSTYCIGPGKSNEKEGSKERFRKWGHNFDTRLHYDQEEYI